MSLRLLPDHGCYYLDLQLELAFAGQPVYTAQMQDTVEMLRIRRLSQHSFRMLVPMAYMKNHNLEEGDHVLWVPDGDGVRLTFKKAEQLVEQLEPEAETQDAAE